MKNILFILLVTFLSAKQEIYKQVRVYIESEETIYKLQHAGLDVDHSYSKDGSWIEFAISDGKMDLLIETNFSFDIIHDDLEHFYASRLDNNYKSRDFELGSMGGYYTFEEIEEQLDILYENYPTLITQKVSLGYTLEGRDVWMVKISDNAEIDEDEPEMLYTGLHHAREPMSYMNLFYFMNWLVENYGVDPEATALINGRELYFIPALNPDGLVYNQSIAPNGGGMQRKNRRETCLSGVDGVDLNRNYSYMWGYDNSGSSPDGCQETYRGASPFSEPETEIIKNFVENHNFKIALNYHSYGNLFIHPLGYDPDLALPEEDNEIFIEFGEAMTEYNNYLLGTGIETVGYTVNGEACDWMYGAHGIYAYTPEVGASSDGFWPATNRILPLAEENLYPNKFAAWAVGAKFNTNFSIQEGPYIYGNTYSTDLSIFNSGLSDSNGSLIISVESDGNYLTFNTESVDIGGILSRESIDLGDIFTFEISPDAPNGIMTNLNIVLTDEDGYEYVTSIDLIIGEPITFVSYNFENENTDWIIGANDDNATAGIWELGVPNATSFNGNQAQPDEDNTLNGESCFITGAATSPGSVGFDDVDGGKTTLYSPIFDLSNYNEVLISYWRWYTNNVGDNPGTDYWKVDISSDGGENWYILENTNQSQALWVKKDFLLSNLNIEFSNEMQLRFIAEDIFNEGDTGTGGSIVEAAIDDFSVLIFENSQSILGDLNDDSTVNVLDVVVLVNIVLANDCTTNADLNSDNDCNVLDIVSLVNLVLN